jgi:predicted PurR-regulated permease PerM
MVALLGPPAYRQARHLTSNVPHIVSQMQRLPVVGKSLRTGDTPARLQRTLRDLPKRISSAPLHRVTGAFADGFLTVGSTLLFTVALLLDGPRLIGWARQLIPLPVEQLDQIGDAVYRSVGRYAMGSLFMAGIGGVVVLITGLVLQVPLAPLLALWMALFDLVPEVGGAIGGLPFVAFALTRSASAAVICAVVLVLYLQLKHHLLMPIVIGKAVRLSSLATMIAALIGVSAGGLAGGLLVIPAVGAAKVAFETFRSAPATPLDSAP